MKEYIEKCLAPSDDTGKLILRLTVAILVFFHGWAKILAPEQVDFIGGLISNMGLPAFIAYGVYIGEVVAPLAMIVGYRTRIAAAVVAFTMVVAILLAHMGDIFALTQFGGWAIELQMAYLMGAIAVFYLGAGKYAFSKDNRWD